MNIGIVGCNGFIGKHLSLFLAKNTAVSLHLFGRSDFNQTTVENSYSKLNVLDKEDTIRKLKDIDLIYYLASDSIPVSSWENPKVEIEKNLLPFLDFLECVVETSIRKIVFVSSAGTIYGTSIEKLDEKADKLPFSPYGINKLTMEYYLNYYQKKKHLSYEIFRVSNIYGENQQTNKGLGIINTFLENIVKNENIKVYGNGETVRNYIYIDDVVRFLATSVDTHLSASNIYNLCSNDNLSINELLKLIGSVVSEDYNLIHVDSRNSDNPFILLDNSKIKAAFPSIDFTPINNGIQSCYKHIKENADF